MEYNKCKFDIYCRFSHGIIPLRKHNKEIDEIKREVDDLKQKIIEKEKEIKVKDEELQLAESKIKKLEVELENEILDKETRINVKDEELENIKTIGHTETARLKKMKNCKVKNERSAKKMEEAEEILADLQGKN